MQKTKCVWFSECPIFRDRRTCGEVCEYEWDERNIREDNADSALCSFGVSLRELLTDDIEDIDYTAMFLW